MFLFYLFYSTGNRWVSAFEASAAERFNPSELPLGLCFWGNCQEFVYVRLSDLTYMNIKSCIHSWRPFKASPYNLHVRLNVTLFYPPVTKLPNISDSHPLKVCDWCLTLTLVSKISTNIRSISVFTTLGALNILLRVRVRIALTLRPTYHFCCHTVTNAKNPSHLPSPLSLASDILHGSLNSSIAGWKITFTLSVPTMN